MTDICIYHKGCTDGFGAAWAVWNNFKDIIDGNCAVEFFPANYQDDPPDVTGLDVTIVDFSYKRPVMDQIIEQCNSLVILDHHKTAEEDLAGIFDHPKVTGVFDMDHSGAVLAWQWFNPDHTTPQLLLHIEDRDLWRFNLDGTREVIAGLYSLPQEFKLWENYIRSGALMQCLRDDGKAIERQQSKNVASLVKASSRRMDIAGFDVPVANVPYMMASDAGHLMAVDEPFSVTYWDAPGERVFSLRSSDTGEDVCAIAKQFGGGGHVHAAGFKVQLGILPECQLPIG